MDTYSDMWAEPSAAVGSSPDTLTAFPHTAEAEQHMSSVVPVDGPPPSTDRSPVRGQRRAVDSFLRDDRWPDFFATAMLLASIFVLIISLVGPWRRYFAREYDWVSILTIPIVPGLVYAALLLVMAEALRRRLRAAWWLLTIWWVIFPELGRIGFLISGRASAVEIVLHVAGLLLMGFVLVVLIRSRRQFTARRVPGSLGLALLVFVVGGIAMLALGAWLTVRFGSTADWSDATSHVLNAMLVDIGRFGGDRRGPLTALGAVPGRPVRRRCGAAVGVPALPTAEAHPFPLRRRRGHGPHPAAGLRRPRLAGLLRHPPGQGHRLGHRRPGHGPGRCLLPRGRLGEPGQR